MFRRATAHHLKALFTCSLFLCPTPASAATFDWNVDADGDWNVNTNWESAADADSDPANDTFPNSTADDAVLNLDITADRTITVPDVTGDGAADFIINRLFVGDPDASHTYIIAGPGKLDLGKTSNETQVVQINNGATLQIDADVIHRNFPDYKGNGTVIVNGTIDAGGMNIDFASGITARINSPILNIGASRQINVESVLEIGMDGTMAPGGGGVGVGQSATFRTFGGNRVVEDDFTIGMQFDDANSEFVGSGGDLTINGFTDFTAASFPSDFRVTSGRLTLAGGVNWENDGDDRYIINGTLEVSGSGNSYSLTGGSTVLDIDGSGTLLLNNADGSATGSASDTLLLDSGITLAGSGSTDSAVDLNGGTVAPGNSIGTLSLGDLTSDSGTFEFELASDGTSDTLNVGNLDLSGIDTLNLLGSVGTPVLTYTLINYTSRTGGFENITFNGNALPSNFALDLGSGNDDSITLTVVPEPFAAGLIILGGLAMLGRRRRDAA